MFIYALTYGCLLIFGTSFCIEVCTKRVANTLCDRIKKKKVVGILRCSVKVCSYWLKGELV